MSIEVRKIVALFSALVLAATLGIALWKGDREMAMVIIPVFSGAIQWYFAKSTALDKPG